MRRVGKNSRKKGPFEISAERMMKMFQHIRELTIKYGIVILFLDEIEDDPN